MSFVSTFKLQVVLKEIDLPVVENGQCQDALRTTRFELE